jgi:hypothetical protein
MKPKIKFLKNLQKWMLTYHYPPREFNLFGATKKEREHIYKACYKIGYYDSLIEAMKALKNAYRSKDVRM